MRRVRLQPPPGFNRGVFRQHAARMTVKINNSDIGTMLPTENSTGSLGWRLDTKGQVTLGGVTVWVQFTLAVTVIGSKDLPKEGT